MFLIQNCSSYVPRDGKRVNDRENQHNDRAAQKENFRDVTNNFQSFTPYPDRYVDACR